MSTIPESDVWFYRPKEVERLTGISIKTLYAHIYAGKLHARKLMGRGWLIPRDGLISWLDQNTTPPQADLSDDLRRVVSRIVRESTAMDHPHAPLHPTGDGFASVDYSDLQQLAQLFHEVTDQEAA